MVQELSNIAIIGAGPAGCACAYFLSEFGIKNVTLIDYSAPLRTILPTGGGRCNLTHAEFDFKELVQNYPRGDKFLYSVFSKFDVSDTLSFFEKLGISTYTQEDGRIFPLSDSSKDVRNKLLEKIKNIKFIKEKALRIEQKQNGFNIVTDVNSYNVDKIIYSTGGHNGYEIIKRLGVSIIEPKPALVGLVTKKKFNQIMGTVLKNVYNKETNLTGDILFTHFGISAPLIYKISSINARKNFPYVLTFDLVQDLPDLQNLLNTNPHKSIKNLLSDIIPHKFAELILDEIQIDKDLKCHKITGTMRDKIEEQLHNYKIEVNGTKKDGETVTCGGVNLDKINSRTMESTEVPNLYFCGEVIDVDGFCGGFNLQNCWSSAYVCANAIFQNL